MIGRMWYLVECGIRTGVVGQNRFGDLPPFGGPVLAGVECSPVRS